MNHIWDSGHFWVLGSVRRINMVDEGQADSGGEASENQAVQRGN